ncbi:unnamed protein product [Musa acuminata subsp. malaccensis]|uniref:(wild Malaysian banana) hypothetical protein n=1 Tax=Musa acuminata subsp. malaccensis TaxID=214687 RepID=A0A804L2Q0_MUSAM|nr:PREDICTED: uncharacterized protein LOC103970065 [Musa acuminata subsp. malaccensis]CAG1863140.1 unnamed protein product [Musa acuminata subsp. malaccensis]
MAGRRQQQATKLAAHRLLAPPAGVAAAGCDADELDESDVWGCPAEPGQAEFAKPVPSSARSRGGHPRVGDRPAAASSLPVNIPDWSKILGNCYGGSNSSSRDWWEEDDDEDGGVGGSVAGPVIPPHELLCRSRAASFSVHEGVGCTLKGRDLNRVRNAIWEKTGFQD